MNLMKSLFPFLFLAIVVLMFIFGFILRLPFNPYGHILLVTDIGLFIVFIVYTLRNR